MSDSALAESVPRSTESAPPPVEDGTVDRLAKEPRDGVRFLSLDAYRGLVMMAMASEGLGLSEVARKHPGSTVWKALAYQSEHVPWTGCAFWDLIQPSFFFLVGAAVPFSLRHRRSRGDSWGRMGFHALIRSIVLVALGVALYSTGHPRTNYTFVNVLAQIGLGYMVVFVLAGAGRVIQILAILALLGGSWWMFAAHPVAEKEEAIARRVPGDWQQFRGTAAHWNKHLNAAGDFDRWFLNKLPREKPFVFNGGGYQTLNFIPSIPNMLIGLMAGDLLLGALSLRAKRRWLLASGIVCLALVATVDHTIWPTDFPSTPNPARVVLDAGWEGSDFASKGWTICPSVKRIWTPTFAVWSSGWTLLFMAGLVWLIEERGWRRWAIVPAVVGMNSIAVYLAASLSSEFILSTIKTHFGSAWMQGDGGPIVERVALVAALWLLCVWLYRQRVFIRI